MPATAAAAGFKVITLPLEENGYPSLEALEAALSERTAALMVSNPDDMGIYNPHIDEWVELVHEAGGLCFYDHANFNGVMGKIRAARARLRRLHVHAAQDLRRAQGRAADRPSAPTAAASGSPRTCPGRCVHVDGERYRLDRRRAAQHRPRARVPRATCRRSSRRMPGCGPWAPRASSEAADLSVLANNYMERRLLQIRGYLEVPPPSRRAQAGDDPLQPRAADRARPASPPSTSRTGWSTSASTRSGSATSPGSCPSRSPPRRARCGRRRTSTTGSPCSRTSARRRTPTRDRQVRAPQPGRPPARPARTR